MSLRELRRATPNPDQPPAGWSFAPPDYVGVGAQRSGTSWWQRLILDHPNVVPPQTLVASADGRTRTKELHYFDRFEERPFSTADAENYARFFPRPSGAVSGEWTPRYMHDYWAPGLIQRAAPEARLVVLLRDPVGRYASAVARVQTRRGARTPEIGPRVSSGALSRSLYHEQLTRLLRHFDRSRLLVLQYERCRESPRAELRRTYEFLGLDDVDHVPAELSARGKEQAHWEMHPELRAELTARLAPDAEHLARDFPEIDLALWENLSRDSGSAPSPAERPLSRSAVWPFGAPPPAKGRRRKGRAQRPSRGRAPRSRSSRA